MKGKVKHAFGSSEDQGLGSKGRRVVRWWISRSTHRLSTRLRPLTCSACGATRICNKCFYSLGASNTLCHLLEPRRFFQ